ncbi:MAG: C10 family peptidase [Tannerellaceae bacterium]|jgi:hypothetical protein|nr:C10 family peptidase [Tannerellaceae bacterium]
MKKLLFLSTTLLLLVLLTTCGEKESLFEREKAPVSQEEKYLFSLGDALSYAGKLQLHNENLITKGEIKAVSQSISMSVGVGKPDFHIINYTNGGFVIVSADKRIPPVIAYSDDSEFDFEGEFPPGLQMWMDNVSQNVKDKRAENAEPDASTTAMWNAFTGNIVAAPPAPTYCTPVGATYTNYQTITYGPLLTTTWSQMTGYNEALTYMGCSVNGYPPVGCVPLAFAQLMRYYQKPSSYSWSSMGPGSSILQNLLKDLGTYLGTYYDCDGSGTDTYYIQSVLPTHYGYSSCTSSGYNYNSLYNYISTNKPVLITGCGTGCHMWICDGLELIYDGTCITGNTIQTTLVSKRLHMNWGSEGGNYNGYYSENHFNPGPHAFNNSISLYFVTK